MSGEDDESNWQICWKVNINFFSPVSGSQRCSACSKVDTISDTEFRSTFCVEATRCSGGHSQMEPISILRSMVGAAAAPRSSLCDECDSSYVLSVLKGEQQCKRNECKRRLQINEVVVRTKLNQQPDVLRDFMSLVERLRTYECGICCEEIKYSADADQTSGGPTPHCNHDRNACDSCLKATFESAIKNGRLEDLKCPHTDCRREVPPASVRQVISPEVFAIYNKKLSLKAMSTDPRFRWCQCGHGQIHANGEADPEWICFNSSCKKRHCYICGDKAANGDCTHLRTIDAKKIKTKQDEKEAARKILAGAAKSREDIRRRTLENEDATLKLISRTCKTCPKAGCGGRIERDEGCGHFTCKKCQCEFCWCCKVIWKMKAGDTVKAMHVLGCKLAESKTMAKAKIDTTGYAKGWDVDEGYDFKLDVAGLSLLSRYR